MYLAASLFIGIPYSLFNGVWPKTIIGWVLVFIFGLPTLILGELIGEKLFNNKISQKIDQAKKDKIIAIRRMAYALIIGIITTAIITLLGYFFRQQIGAHFSIQ